MGAVRAAAGQPLTFAEGFAIDVEQWVADGGWLVELLLPRTDGGVLAQALVLVALLRPATHAGLLQLWIGGSLFLAGLFVLRASH